jgi:hypothetical protein
MVSNERRIMEAGRRARVHRPAGALPPQPLAVVTQQSRRAPHGRPRCQYWGPRGDKFWQCQRPARQGFRVCGVHGAGYAKREREGLRTNPALAPVVTGTKASAATQQVLLEGQPNLRALYDAHLHSDHLLDLRPQLALSKALVEHYIEQEGTVTSIGPRGSDPAILRAVAALETCARVAQRIVELENKMGPVTRAELDAVINAFARTLARFVPDDRLGEAAVFMRSELGVVGLEEEDSEARRSSS